MPANVFQAEAVPVVREVKCTEVQRDIKIEKVQAWLLLGVITSKGAHSLSLGWVSADKKLK
jgi:hypothetical protein